MSKTIRAPQNPRKQRRGLLLRLVTGLLLLASIGVVLAGAWVHVNFERHLPEDFFRLCTKGESPRFYAYHFSDRQNRMGEKIDVTASIYAQRDHLRVSYEEIPKDMIHAFLAIEDHRFFEHEGVDWFRTGAALVHYLFGSSKSFGGSTITQQLIKNLTGDDDVSPSRKLREILYALDLERNMEKQEILELYLNVISFSDQCYGIAEAASHYFSKEVGELSTAECACIAAITNRPSYYNPIRNPQNNLERRNLILSQMYAYGYLTEEDYQEARESPLGLCPRDAEAESVNSWYADMVIEDVIADLMTEYGMSRHAASTLFYEGGLQIEIAMDESIQQIVEAYYKERISVPTNADGVRAESALILIDARTGDILGVAGAIGEKQGNRIQNFATQTLRAPGSTIKPISVYAPAIEQGLINWASVYDDVPVRFGSDGGSPWPANATGIYRGLTDVAYAVAHSTNTVAVRILEQLGLETSYRYAKEVFHLSSLRAEAEANDRDFAALALGQLNYGVTLREITAAYTPFANAGIYHPYRSYYRVTDADGRVLLANSDAGEVAISPETAGIMTKLMQGVIEEGTSSSITLSALTECAGKTGTSGQDHDRWFIGYTPELICGVWCGYAYPEPLVGRNICTQIWDQVMKQILRERGGERKFEVPNTLIRASYCCDSGALPTDACCADPRGGRIKEGWFVREQMPHMKCERHVLCDYDKVFGGVCHGACPEDCIKKVGLVRVERHFPGRVRVKDAEFVYWGDPYTMEANEDPDSAYFANEHKGIYGTSGKEKPFHRSCTVHHTEVTEEKDFEFESALPNEE